MFIQRIIAAAACVGFLGSAVGAELLVTDGGMAKSRNPSTNVALDIVSDGDIRGFDIIIPVPKGVKVNTSRCLASLPAGFQGMCKHNEGEVAVIAISMEPKTLPAGIHSIGTISISGGKLARRANVQFNAVGIDAKSLSSNVQMSVADTNSRDR